MTAGIYEIVNTTNSHRYIGSSVDINTRWYSHKYSLSHDTHSNQVLKRAWDKHGEDSFEFNILAYCPKESLLFIEQIFLNEEPHEYNIADNARAPRLGRPHSEETREKLREMATGNQHWLGKKHSEFSKQKIRIAKTGIPCSEITKQKIRGFRHTEEAKIKMSIAKKGLPSGFIGKNHTEEAKEKNRLAHLGNKYCVGKKLTEEHKRKISETLTGFKHSEETKQKLRNKNISEETRNKLSITTANYWKRKKQLVDCEVIL